MNGKKTADLVRGSACLVLGAWMAAGNLRVIVYFLRIGGLGGWDIAETVLRSAASVYFIWVGARMIRRVSHKISKPRIGWGRLLLGIVIIYIEIKDQFVPNPSALRPDNADQAFGMQVMRALLLMAGVALIFAAFWQKKDRDGNVLQENANSTAPKLGA
jgi:hypothetical protein